MKRGDNELDQVYEVVLAGKYQDSPELGGDIALVPAFAVVLFADGITRRHESPRPRQNKFGKVSELVILSDLDDCRKLRPREILVKLSLGDQSNDMGENDPVAVEVNQLLATANDLAVGWWHGPKEFAGLSWYGVK